MGFGIQKTSYDEIQVSHLFVTTELRFLTINALVHFRKVYILSLPRKRRVKEGEGGDPK